MELFIHRRIRAESASAGCFVSVYIRWFWYALDLGVGQWREDSPQTSNATEAPSHATLQLP